MYPTTKLFIAGHQRYFQHKNGIHVVEKRSKEVSRSPLLRRKITTKVSTTSLNLRMSHCSKLANFSFCRKLKNREAAQTSRDRKKARMEELEKIVKQLQKSVSRRMTLLTSVTIFETLVFLCHSRKLLLLSPHQNLVFARHKCAKRSSLFNPLWPS